MTESRAPRGDADRDPLDVPVLEVVNAVLRHRWWATSVAITVPVIVVGWLLLSPRTYTAEASFYPQESQESVQRLSGLAAQFGINLGGRGRSESPTFYADLLRSRAILASAVESRYAPPSEAPRADRDSSRLIELYRIEADDPELRRLRATRRLEENLEVATDSETGVVRFSVTSERPWLARQIADRLLTLLNDFNLEVRQSQAAAEREFLEDRLAEARQDLRAAEDSLERFLENNRRYESSPTLRFEHDRLQRRVSHHNQLVTSLAQSFEEARISEVRDLPVVTVVSDPVAPPEPDSRGLLLMGPIAVFAGAILGLLVAFFREYLSRSPASQSDAYEEYQGLIQDVRSDLRKVGGWVRQRDD